MINNKNKHLIKENNHAILDYFLYFLIASLPYYKALPSKFLIKEIAAVKLVKTYPCSPIKYE